MTTAITAVPDVETVVRIQKRLKLSDADIAATLGVDQSTYWRWRTRTSSPAPMARIHMEQLQDMMDLLRRVFNGADLAREWLGTAKPEMLGGTTTPLMAMRQGRIDRVLTLLNFLARGA